MAKQTTLYGLGKATLVNVEQRAKRNPSTFHIAPKAERTSHEPGDLVKLIWEDPEFGGERMWVNITEATESGGKVRYAGELDNVPAVLEDIEVGDEVTFGPEHIADSFGESAGRNLMPLAWFGALGGFTYLAYRIFKGH